MAFSVAVLCLPQTCSKITQLSHFPCPLAKEIGFSSECIYESQYVKVSGRQIWPLSIEMVDKPEDS